MPNGMLTASICGAAAILTHASLGLRVHEQGGRVLGAFAIPVVLGILLLLGTLRRYRWAWVGARVMTGGGGILASMNAAFVQITVSAAPSVRFMLLAAEAAFLLIAFFALGTSSARDYVDLLCPRCKGQRIVPADPCFHEARCRRCGIVW